MTPWSAHPATSHRCCYSGRRCTREARDVDGRPMCLFHWHQFSCAYECAESLGRALDAVREDIHPRKAENFVDYDDDAAYISEILTERLFELLEKIEYFARPIPSLSSPRLDKHAMRSGEINISTAVARYREPGKVHKFCEEIFGEIRIRTGVKSRAFDAEREVF